MIHESKHARHNQYIYLKFVLLGHLIIYFLKMRVYEHTYIHTHIYVYATIYIYIYTYPYVYTHTKVSGSNYLVEESCRRRGAPPTGGPDRHASQGLGLSGASWVFRVR